MFETFDSSIDRRNDFESVHLFNISNFDSTKCGDSKQVAGDLLSAAQERPSLGSSIGNLNHL